MSRPVAHRRAIRPALALLAGALLLSVPSVALAQDGTVAPGDPGTGASPGAGPISFDDDATPTAPQPGSTVDPRPVAWDHVTIAPDGRTVTVYFWNGVEPCFALERIEVAQEGGTYRITPFTGYRADAAAIDCIEMLQLYSTVVELPAPVLGGGLADAAGLASVDGEAEIILPGATLAEPRVQPWERVQVGPDGRSLWVWFTGGATPCFGLGQVDLADVDGLPTLTLFTGPTDTMAMCIAIAVQYRTPVAVPDAILLGGQP